MRYPSAPLALTAAILVIAGCSAHDTAGASGPSTTRTGATAAVSSGPSLHVAATLTLRPASTLVATPRWLWVLGGPSGVLTQVDPTTNTVVRTVRSPHPAGYGTFAGGSLWIASLLDHAVMQVDADSGQILRTIESRGENPFFRPIGMVSVGKDLWVVNHADGPVRSTLVRLDDETGEVTGTTELPGHHAGSPLLAGGQIWITLTTEGTVVHVDPGTGFVVGTPIVVDSGCLSASVADGDLWLTGLDAGDDFPCRNASRRLDPLTATLSPVVYAAGKSLVTYAVEGGSLWASDIGRTIYRVDADSGAIRPALTLDGPRATHRLITAFGSLWVLGGETGQLVRVDAT